jgi:hypothetical protein
MRPPVPLPADRPGLADPFDVVIAAREGRR